jgi:hypothetical protein
MEQGMIADTQSSIAAPLMRVGERVVQECRFELTSFLNALSDHYRPDWSLAVRAAFDRGERHPDVAAKDTPLLGYVLTNQRVMALEMGGSLAHDVELSNVREVLETKGADPLILLLEDEPPTFIIAHIKAHSELLVAIKQSCPNGAPQ